VEKKARAGRKYQKLSVKEQQLLKSFAGLKKTINSAELFVRGGHKLAAGCLSGQKKALNIGHR